MSDFSNDLAHDPDKVARALKRLPFLEREALLLKTRDRMSYAEIGAVLGLTPAQAEAKLASALVRLHDRLARPKSPWWRRARSAFARIAGCRPMATALRQGSRSLRAIALSRGALIGLPEGMSRPEVIERAIDAALAELHRQAASSGCQTDENGRLVQIDGSFEIEPLVRAVLDAADLSPGREESAEPGIDPPSPFSWS